MHRLESFQGANFLAGSSARACLVSIQVKLPSMSGLLLLGHTICTCPSRSSLSKMSFPKRSVMPTQQMGEASDRRNPNHIHVQQHTMHHIPWQMINVQL